MNDIQLNEANLENLTQLWMRMGAKPCPLVGMEMFQISDSWPNRCWPKTQRIADDSASIAHGIKQLPKTCIVPVPDLRDATTIALESLLASNGFEVLSEQTAMHLDLKDYPVKVQSTLKLASLSSDRDIEIWTDIAATSFEYEIDMAVIRKVAVDPDVQLLMAYFDDRPAATVMLFMTNNVCGVHQLGVLPEYRGQGIARKLMQDIIAMGSTLNGRYITLQASNAAAGLYKGLGFTQQFKIRNWSKSS